MDNFRQLHALLLFLKLKLLERVVCPEQFLVLVQLGGLGDGVDATTPRANNTLLLLAT